MAHPAQTVVLPGTRVDAVELRSRTSRLRGNSPGREDQPAAPEQLDQRTCRSDQTGLRRQRHPHSPRPRLVTELPWKALCGRPVSRLRLCAMTRWDDRVDHGPQRTTHKPQATCGVDLGPQQENPWGGRGAEGEPARGPGRSPGWGLGARLPENTTGREDLRLLQILLGPRNEWS